MTGDDEYEIDLSPVKQPAPDPDVDPSHSLKGSPPGSWKHERPTEQDEIDSYDPNYRE